MSAAEVAPRGARWPLWIIHALSAAGIGAGVYMARHHETQLYGGEAYAAETLVGCEEAAGVSCDVVNTSAWSELWGVPLFAWAVPFYVLIIALALLGGRGRRGALPLIVAAGLASTGFSGFLYFISKVELGYVCLWCMRLYAINLALPVLALVAGAPRGRLGPPTLAAFLGLGAAGIALAQPSVAAQINLALALPEASQAYPAQVLYALLGLVPTALYLVGLPADDRPSAPTLAPAGGAWLASTVVVVGAVHLFRAQLLAGAPVIADLPDAPAPTAALEAKADPEGPAPAFERPTTTEDDTEGVLRVREDDAWKGNPDAKVTIVEYADFECGYCKRAGFELTRIFEAYKDRVLFVYKHFPMDPACNPGVNNKRHRYACDAHAAAVCAKEQGKFWAYHDLLYKNNHQLQATALLAYAEKLGLDMDAFNTCVRSGEAHRRVALSGSDGKDVAVHGTPRIFIDGQLYRGGRSAEQMARFLEARLAAAGQASADATAKLAAFSEPAVQTTPIPADVPEMRRIQHGGFDFWIDTFESAVQDGKARSGKREIPGTRMSWFAARDACEAVGKRMCTEAEWITACQSAAAVDDDGDGQTADDLIEGTAYPYGDLHTPTLCWEAKEVPRHLPPEQRPAWRPVYTGELPGCVTQDGVYDMTGNVEEWVGESPEKAVLLGGAFDTPDDKARCYRRNDTFGAGYANLRTGFRCCRSGP